MALMRLGQRKIQSISNQSDPNAVAMLVAWAPTLGEVSREAPWNCVKKPANLGMLAPGQLPTGNPCPFPIPSTATQWVPGANYAVNAYVLFANYLYQCLIANQASASFTADLTRGYWFQTNYFSPNYLGGYIGGSPLYPNAFELPVDFVLLTRFIGQYCWNRGGTWQGPTWQIMGKALWTAAPYAAVEYCCLETDTTKYDALFCKTLWLGLAMATATTLRKDAGQLAASIKPEYDEVLADARQKNGAEDNPRRFNIVQGSRFVRSRRRSTNG